MAEPSSQAISSRRTPRRLSVAAILVLLVGVAGIEVARRSAPAATATSMPGTVRLSLFAFGDTGKKRHVVDLYRTQRDVAEAVAAEDRARPAQAIVLLGDNFYPEGLRADEVADRLADNIVEPYCRFVQLGTNPGRELLDACAPSASDRNPIPIYAVLGNHDHNSPESPVLQREVMPSLISNWTMAKSDAEVFELGHGVSLVLFDSMAMRRGTGEAAVRDALRRSLGPWRILAGHHPLHTANPDGQALARAIAESKVPLHLLLAGHEHNLQLVQFPAPGPFLNVVSGGGSDWREIDTEQPGRVFGLGESGFARVDLVERGGGARLVVSLFAVPHRPLIGSGPTQLVARWSVDPGGGLVNELAADAGAAQ